MIGVFDSGSGGLSVLCALKQEMPSIDVVYFGDMKNAPYGEKNRKDLTQLTVAAIERLQQEGARRIVSACNSVSASLAVSLYDSLLLGEGALIEMVGPTVATFRHYPGRITVCATTATIESDMYQSGFRMAGCSEVTMVALPALAGMIEAETHESTIKEYIAHAFAPILFKVGDVVILACTHYPLVVEIFTQVLPPFVRVYDPSCAVAERAKKLWWPQEVGNGQMMFLLSKDSSVFRGLLVKLFPNDRYTVRVVD